MVPLRLSSLLKYASLKVVGVAGVRPNLLHFRQKKDYMIAIFWNLLLMNLRFKVSLRRR